MKLYEDDHRFSVPASVTVCVRVQEFQLEELRKAFPGKSVSWAVRTCIDRYLQEKCNTCFHAPGIPGLFPALSRPAFNSRTIHTISSRPGRISPPFFEVVRQLGFPRRLPIRKRKPFQTHRRVPSGRRYGATYTTVQVQAFRQCFPLRKLRAPCPGAILPFFRRFPIRTPCFFLAGALFPCPIRPVPYGGKGRLLTARCMQPGPSCSLEACPSCLPCLIPPPPGRGLC